MFQIGKVSSGTFITTSFETLASLPKEDERPLLCPQKSGLCSCFKYGITFYFELLASQVENHSCHVAEVVLVISLSERIGVAG